MTNENTCYSERSLHGLNINVKKGKRVKEDLCMVGKDYESGQVQQTCIITSTQRSTDNEGGPIIDDQRENIQNMNTERFIGYPISQNIIYSPKTILQEASHKRTPAILSHNDTYNIIQLIGEGVYGKVTWCRKRSTGQFVAIKTLKYDGCVATEIRMLKLLQNVDTDNFHIVQLLECFHRNARSYLVFELLEQNLLDFQKANNFAPLPAKHIRTIATQLLRALEKLKELSIIHTDIKPDNIMLVEHMQFPFRVKVIDFGSASILPEVQHIRDPYIQARYYRSPEILLGLPFCEKLDMWSLGCVLAELRLGSPLYPGKNQYDQIRIIVETQGLPKDDLLNQASKAHLFFKRNSNPYSTRQWQLKSLPEYQSKKLPQPLEPRRRTLKSLDQLEPFSIIETLFPNDEDIAEFHDRNSMIALLKRMLNFDPKNRISPRTALRHSFITMGQLKKNYMHTKYYELSVQGLDAALNYGRVERDKHNCHLLKESQYYDANTMHRESMQDQPNHNIAFVQTAVRKRDDFTIGKSERMHGLKVPPGGTNSPVRQPFTPFVENARYLPYPYQETCHQISWCVHRHAAESTPENPTSPPSSHPSGSDHSFGNVILLDQRSDRGCTSKDGNTNKLSIIFPSKKEGQENKDKKSGKYSSKSSVTEEKKNKKAQPKETAAVQSDIPRTKENYCTWAKSYISPKSSPIKALIRRENMETVSEFTSPIHRDSSCGGTKQYVEPGVHLYKQQNSISTGRCKSHLRHTEKKTVLTVPEQNQLNSDNAVKSGDRRIRTRTGRISRSKITHPKANNQSILEDRGEQESEEADLINIRLKQIVKRHKLGSETEMNSSRMQVNEAKDSEEEESADKDSHKIFQRAKFQRRSKKIQKKKNVSCWG